MATDLVDPPYSVEVKTRCRRIGVPNGEFKWGHASIYLPDRADSLDYLIAVAEPV